MLGTSLSITGPAVWLLLFAALVEQRRDEGGALHLTVNEPQFATRRDEGGALHLTVLE